MIAVMSQQGPTMSLTPSLSSPPKKPRLSLQIKTASTPMTINKSATALKADIDTSSPTAFNTLSNAYAAAIEQASPKTSRPPITLNTSSITSPTKRTSLHLITNAGSQDGILFPSQRTQTPGPFTVVYPDTPNTACSSSSPLSAYPSLTPGDAPTFTFTPPHSAHPSDDKIGGMFSFTTGSSNPASPISPRTPRRRATIASQYLSAPYTHPRTLHSILRNSPLPPRGMTSPISPTRVSKRLAEKASKKVCYNNPLTQTITTNKYVKSHIDLLAEEASPYSATDGESGALQTLDLAMAYTGDETRDGGQTPGPFEEMRRRMAGLSETDPETPATKKKQRKEKNRQWIWTIGTNEEEAEEEEEEEEQSEYTSDLAMGAVTTELLLPMVYVPPPRAPPQAPPQDTEMLDRPYSAHFV